MVQNVDKNYFYNYEYSQYTKNKKTYFPNYYFQYSLPIASLYF